MPSTARMPPLKTRTSPSTSIPRRVVTGSTLAKVEVANDYVRRVPCETDGDDHGGDGGKRGLVAHRAAVHLPAHAFPRDRLGVRARTRPAHGPQGARPGRPGAHARPRRGAGLRQLQRHGHHRPPRGPRARRAPLVPGRPAREDARRHRGGHRRPPAREGAHGGGAGAAQAAHARGAGPAARPHAQGARRLRYGRPMRGRLAALALLLAVVPAASASAADDADRLAAALRDDPVHVDPGARGRLPVPAAGQVRLRIVRRDIGRIRIAVVSGGTKRRARGLDALSNAIPARLQRPGTLLLVANRDWWLNTSYAPGRVIAAVQRAASSRHGLQSQLLAAVDRIAAAHPGPAADPTAAGRSGAAPRPRPPPRAP